MGNRNKTRKEIPNLYHIQLLAALFPHYDTLIMISGHFCMNKNNKTDHLLTNVHTVTMLDRPPSGYYFLLHIVSQKGPLVGASCLGLKLGGGPTSELHVSILCTTKYSSFANTVFIRIDATPLIVATLE